MQTTTKKDRLIEHWLPMSLLLLTSAFASSFLTSVYDRAGIEPKLAQLQALRVEALALRQENEALRLGAASPAPPVAGLEKFPTGEIVLRGMTVGDSADAIRGAISFLNEPPEESPWAAVKNAASLLRDGVGTAVALSAAASWLYSRRRQRKRREAA